MRNPVYRPQWMIVLTSVVVAGMSVASGETFPAFFAEQHLLLQARRCLPRVFPRSTALWIQVVMPIFAGPTLLPTKQRSPNFTRRTVILCFGFRTAASVPRGWP
jgi:hypothetical protein